MQLMLRFLLSRRTTQRQMALAAMLIAVVLSHMMPIIAKVLYERGWDPPVLYFAVLIITSIVLGAHEFIVLERGERWGMTRQDILGTLVSTVTGGVIGPLLFFTGLRTVMVSDAIVLTSLMPFLVVTFAVIFLKEHFTTQTIFGGLFLACGIVILLWQKIISFTVSPGVPLILTASLLSALTLIVHKKYIVHRHLDSIILVRTVISMVLVGAWLLFTNPSSLQILVIPQNIWLFLALPICGFIVPFFLFFRSLRKGHVKAMDAGFIAAMGRVIGIVLAASLLGEDLHATHAISIAFMIAGILVKCPTHEVAHYPITADRDRAAKAVICAEVVAWPMPHCHGVSLPNNSRSSSFVILRHLFASSDSTPFPYRSMKSSNRSSSVTTLSTMMRLSA